MKSTSPAGMLGNPFKRGANKGLIMGLWLSLMFLLWSLGVYGGMYGSMTNLIALPMTIAVPFILYVMLRRSYAADGYMSTLSMLWMEGIMIFICGTVIALLSGYIFMRFVDPGFIHTFFVWMRDMARLGAQGLTGSNAAEYEDIARTLTKAIKNGDLPDPMSLLLNVMWFIVSAGSIISLIVSLIVRAIPARGGSR